MKTLKELAEELNSHVNKFLIDATCDCPFEVSDQETEITVNVEEPIYNDGCHPRIFKRPDRITELSIKIKFYEK